MSAEHVRAFYAVPAKRGGRVIFDGQPGTITGFAGPYLRVRLDGERQSVPIHPTWRVQYL